jgi:hypothetical protein
MPDVLPSWLARTLAMEAHAGQVDKIGKPYIGHPARIAMAVREEGYSDEVEAVAWLHDVVEDTDVTLADLYVHGFSVEVIDAVDAISKRKGEKFEAYYERVKANPMALVVKWHDVADNSDPRRLAKVAPDTRERLRAKYERARTLLTGGSPAETIKPSSPKGEQS